jgi:hypothetical protein
MDQDLYKKLRKRLLMFYFAAGMNLIMGLWVLSASGPVASGTRMVIVLVFLAFAALNFYMARKLKKQWDAHLREQGSRTGDAVTK